MNQEEIPTKEDFYKVCQHESGPILVDLIRYFIEQRVDVCSPDSNGWTAVHYLCKHNHTKQLKKAILLLLDRGIDVNDATSNRWNALHIACRYNTSEHLRSVVNLLIKRGIHVNAQTLNGWTALDLLCRNNFTPCLYDVISVLLENGASVNGSRNRGSTPLHLLCQYNRSDKLPEIVELFIARGADVEVRDAAGMRAFDLLCCHNQTDKLLSTVKVFVQSRVNTRAKDEKGRTILHYLCQYNQSPYLYDALRFLIKLVDLRAKDRTGKTATELLCRYNQTYLLCDILDLFVQYDQNIKTVNGVEAFHSLCKYNHDNILDAAAHFLSPAVVNAKDKYGSSALHILCRYSRTPALLTFINILMKYQKDINSRNAYGTVLHVLCRNNQSEYLLQILQYLIRKGLDVTTVDRNGWTAIHLLCRYNHSEQLIDLVDLLLNRGLDVARFKVHEWNALHVLCRYNQSPQMFRVVRLLLSHGVNARDTIADGSTALHMLCRWNHGHDLYNILAHLISHRLDVRIARRSDGSTALHVLCRYSKSHLMLRIINLFIRNGIDVNARKRDGATALHVLCQYQHKKLLTGVIKYLIERNADVNIRTRTGETALHSLFRYNLHGPVLDAFFLLFNNKIHLNALDESGKTALTRSLLNPNGHVHKIFRYLFRGVDHLHTNLESIIDAAKYGCVFLVEHFAKNTKYNYVDHYDRDAFDYLRLVWRDALSLCPRCRKIKRLGEMKKQLRELIRGSSDMKPVVRVATVRRFSKTELEQSVRIMDVGNYFKKEDFPITLPSIRFWREMCDRWHSNQLDLMSVLNYLEKSVHEAQCNGSCDWCLVHSDVVRYLMGLFEQMELLDNRFKLHKLVEYGSWAERTKIFGPDEFDFAFVLEKFRQVQANSEYVVYYRDDPKVVSSLCDDQCGTISSGRLLYYFYRLMAEAVERIFDVRIFSPQVRFGETCATLIFTYRGPHLSPLTVGIDITPAVCLQKSDHMLEELPSWCASSYRSSGQRYLVPLRSDQSHPKWQYSYANLEREIIFSSGESVQQVLCMLKLFVALHQHDQDEEKISRKLVPSSYALKTCLFYYLNQHPPSEGECWNLKNTINNCIGVLEQFDDVRPSLTSFFDQNVNVFDISSESKTVVREIIDRLKAIRMKTEVHSFS